MCPKKKQAIDDDRNIGHVLKGKKCAEEKVTEKT